MYTPRSVTVTARSLTREPSEEKARSSRMRVCAAQNLVYRRSLRLRSRARMDRVQLFEFEDLPWFPQVVRECMTDFLSFLGQRGKSVYAGFAQRLASAVQAT